MRKLMPVLLIAGALLIFPLLVIAQTDGPTPEPTPTLSPQIIQIDPADPALPADEAPIPRIHVVAEGESLFFIAQQYGTTPEALQIANSITDAALLFVGAELIVPGAVGEEVPTVYTVKIGDTPAAIAAQFNTSIEAVASINNFVQNGILPAGQEVAVMSRTGSATPREITGTPYIVRPDDSIYSISLKTGAAVETIREINNLSVPTTLFPGQRLRIPSNRQYRLLPHEWVAIELSSFPIAPGDTLSLYVENLQPGEPTGVITAPDGITYPLRFIPANDGFQTLIGMDAFAVPGDYELSIGGVGIFRPWLPFEQSFEIATGNYGLQQITIAPQLAYLLEPEVRASEDELLNDIFVSSQLEPMWDGFFALPISGTITARYGDSRSYNGGPVSVFHTGIDFAGTIGTPILAPADGRVVYSDTLELRGNVLVLDHGMGVMTAYYHLSNIDVSPGDDVTVGQKVAEGGNTGLSTGPHLHWDLRVWGSAVNPVQWLDTQFP